jgi:hypothetical protein
VKQAVKDREREGKAHWIEEQRQKVGHNDDDIPGR